MWITSVLISLLVVLLALFYRKRKENHRILHEIGLTGPAPHWYYGNLHQLEHLFGRPSYPVFMKWRHKYGKTFGYYEGSRPIIMTSDPDFLKDVFIKKFSMFPGRQLFPIYPDPDSPSASASVHMFDTRGPRWKRLRTIVNPTFSSAKMKQMAHLISGNVDHLLQQLDNIHEKDQPVNIYPLYQGLTMQVIAECAFGMDIEFQENNDHPVFNLCRQMFAFMETSSLLFRIFNYLPEIGPFVSKLIDKLPPFGPGVIFSALGNHLKSIIKLRKNNDELRRIDLLQLMLDAEDATADHMTLTRDSAIKLQEGKTGRADEETGNAASSKATDGKSSISKRRLTTDEVVAQSSLFLLAGFETSSNTLAFCTHFLANNPDVQEKLQREIDETLGENPPTYDAVHGMEYLDQVISETLRHYPIASIAINRTCAEPCTVQGYHIPPGVTVKANVWALHFDPELWGPDSEKFDPDRFSADMKKSRHEMAWIPFGAGPRNCVGMRFALMEIKLALSKILQKYSLIRCVETEDPIVVKEAVTVSPRNGVTVRLRLRNK